MNLRFKLEAQLTLKLHFPGHVWRAAFAILAMMFYNRARKKETFVGGCNSGGVCDGGCRLVCTCVSSFLSSGC